MSNELDLQDKTRMLDVYKSFESIIDQISKLQVFPPLVWVWSWDVAKSTYSDFQEDPDYIMLKSIEQTWELFYTQADQNDFTLEYGTEDLYEAVRDWMIDADIVARGEVDGDEDDVLESIQEEV